MKNEYMTKSPVMARLVQYIKYIGKSVNAFEAEWGVSKNYIRNTERYIKPEYLDKLMSDHPDIDLNWLIAGRGSMLLSETENLSENKTNLAKQNEKDQRLTHKDVQKLLTKQKNEIMSELSKMFERFTDTIDKQIASNNNQVEKSFTLMMKQMELISNMMGRVEEKTDNVIKLNKDRKIS